jgi:hypothetical protein
MEADQYHFNTFLERSPRRMSAAALLWSWRHVRRCDKMGLASCAIPAAGANVPSHSCPLEPSVATVHALSCSLYFTSLVQ